MAENDRQVPALFRAIEHNDFEKVKVLVDSFGLSPDQDMVRVVSRKERETFTALYLASSMNRPTICSYLLEKGANPFKKKVFGMYPVHVACDRGYHSVLKVFLDRNCDLNRIDDNGDTPLHLSSLRGNLKCVELLLLAGAKVDIRNKDDKTALEEAAHSQRWDVVKLLRQYNTKRLVHRTQSANALRKGDILSGVEQKREKMLSSKNKSRSEDHSAIPQIVGKDGCIEQEDLDELIPSNNGNIVVIDTYRWPRSVSFREHNHTQRIHIQKSQLTQDGSRGRLQRGGSFHGKLPFHGNESSRHPHNEIASSPKVTMVTFRCLPDGEANDAIGLSTVNQMVHRMVGSFFSLQELPSPRGLSPLDNCSIVSDHLLLTSRNLLLESAGSLGLNVADAKKWFLSEDAQPKGQEMVTTHELIHGWDYEVREEQPFWTIVTGDSLVLYFHIKIMEKLFQQKDFPSHMTHQNELVLKVIISPNDVTTCSNPKHHGNCFYSDARNPAICSPLLHFQGTLSGFRKYLKGDIIDRLGCRSYSYLSTRAQFTIQEDFVCTLKKHLDSRRQNNNRLTEDEAWSVLFQGLIAASYLEGHGQQNCTINKEVLLLRENGTVCLNMGSCKEDNGTSYNNGMQSLHQLDTTMTPSIRSLGDVVYTYTINSTTGSSCSYSQKLAAFLDYLRGYCSPSIPSSIRVTSQLLMHVCFMLLQEDSRKFTPEFHSLSHCQHWLTSQRLQMYFTKSATSETRPCVTDLQFLFLVFAEPFDIRDACQILNLLCA